MYICVFYEHIKELARESGNSVEASMNYAKSIGIDALDADYSEITKESPTAFRTSAESCGMKVASVYAHLKMQSRENLHEGIEFINSVKEIGAHNAMILPGGADDISLRNNALENMMPVLDELGEYAESLGITLSLENFSQLIVPYTLIADFEYIFAHSKHLYFALDTGNFSFHDESPYDAYLKFKDRISHVHLKNWDYPSRRENESPAFITLSEKKLYPYHITDDGIIPIDKILSALKESGYNGALSIENFGVSPVSDGLKKSADYIKMFL